MTCPICKEGKLTNNKEFGKKIEKLIENYGCYPCEFSALDCDKCGAYLVFERSRIVESKINEAR